MNHFYTIDLRNAPEIQWILGFQSSVLEKGLDNPRRYFVSRTCKEIVVTNGTTGYVLSIPTGYYTYLEFIEAVDSDELGEVDESKFPSLLSILNFNKKLEGFILMYLHIGSRNTEFV